MAHLIQPCCSHKHLGELRSILKKEGTAEFEGYGDMSLTELLPPLVNHYNGTRLLIAAPALPDQAADIIKSCMRREWTVVDGSKKIPVITHLTIVADLSPEKSPKASQWLKNNPFGERLTLIDKEQEETVILLPDFAITGPVNLRYGHHFVAKAMGRPEDVAALWERFLKPEEPEADQTTPDTADDQTTPTPPTQEGKPTAMEAPTQEENPSAGKLTQEGKPTQKEKASRKRKK